MSLQQIENNLKSLLESIDTNTFIYDFLTAYNAPKSAITRLKNGSLNISKIAGEIIWKKKVFYKQVYTHELQSILPQIIKDERISKNQLRFIIVTDNETLVACDTKTLEQIETPIANLLQHVTFFLPLAGMEKYKTHEENEADVKAAVQMAKLFDEIKKTNPTNTAEQIHHLNIFLSRLLFCFFAEDTGIFSTNLFTSSINNHTQQDGSDLATYLENLFNILNTEHREPSTPAYLNVFPYVNGGLFKTQINLPKFTFKSREAIIKSGGENWAAINPDIFGSMIQAVVTPDQRGNLGMHYTSVPNIMKVIQPLFLDELHTEFEASKNNPTALNKLLGRIANIRIFDPACGSGNFLIIAYKQLRLLEIKILLQLKNTANQTTTGFEDKKPELFGKPQLSLADAKPQFYQMELFTRIELNHFFGIELDDFAHEIAKLSLWLAQHQMNVEFNSILGSQNPSLPLRDAGVIVQGNATRLNWETICPKPNIGEVYILGNPPYLGSGLQNLEHKEDMAIVFKDFEEYKKLDYICCWFILGQKYIANSNNKLAFVSTNSICQGEQVGILWSIILKNNIEIFFAHQSFKWTNNAKANAGVSVIVIGLQETNSKEKKLFSNNSLHYVKNINPYLSSAKNVIVYPRKTSISNFSEMIKGSSPSDDSNLLLNEEEYEYLITNYLELKPILKKYVGADEFMNGKKRFCIWVTNDTLNLALSNELLLSRFEKVKQFRLKSKKSATQKLANTPYFFDERKYKNLNSILIPQTGSEKREYLPVGFMDKETIVSNATRVIYSNSNYLFGILSSKMHIIWIRAIAGRLKMDMQYSNTLCYNTFPFPPITQSQKDILEQHTHNILRERAKHSHKTLAQLYDPKEMPEGLRQAHQANDLAIEKCYRDKHFENDEERLAHLFKLYEQMIEEEKTKGTLFNSVKSKKNKK